MVDHETFVGKLNHAQCTYKWKLYSQPDTYARKTCRSDEPFKIQRLEFRLNEDNKSNEVSFYLKGFSFVSYHLRENSEVDYIYNVYCYYKNFCKAVTYVPRLRILPGKNVTKCYFKSFPVCASGVYWFKYVIDSRGVNCGWNPTGILTNNIKTSPLKLHLKKTFLHIEYWYICLHSDTLPSQLTYRVDIIYVVYVIVRNIWMIHLDIKVKLLSLFCNDWQ